MPATKIGSKWVSGLLEFFKKSTGDTVLKVTEDGIAGNITGALTGTITPLALSKAADYALTAAEKSNSVFALKMTAGSKSYTMALPNGQVVLVYNSGSETFTLKIKADDTGTSLATGKVALVIASTTKDVSIVTVLNAV